MQGTVDVVLLRPSNKITCLFVSEHHFGLCQIAITQLLLFESICDKQHNDLPLVAQDTLLSSSSAGSNDF